MIKEIKEKHIQELDHNRAKTGKVLFPRTVSSHAHLIYDLFMHLLAERGQQVMQGFLKMHYQKA
jgi:hypothetical protein